MKILRFIRRYIIINKNNTKGNIEKIKCPICGCDYTNIITVKYADSEIFKVIQCLNVECLHGFTNPLPSEEYLNKIYSDNDLNSYMLDENNLKKVSEFETHLFSNYIPKGFEKAGTLLDVGSGIGTFMSIAKEFGWDVNGIEFNKCSVEIAQNRYGLDIQLGSFYNLENYFKNKKFDLISMNHVFEHILDPKQYIEYMIKFLKPNGCLLISVPNILADDFRNLGPMWDYLHIPNHISYFSRFSIDKVFSEKIYMDGTEYKFKKVFQSSFNSPRQIEGEGLTSMYQMIVCSN